MDDRVHARLVADGLDMGMASAEALAWADLRAKSAEASAIRLGLAMRDLDAALRQAAERNMAKIAAAFRRTAR